MTVVLRVLALSFKAAAVIVFVYGGSGAILLAVGICIDKLPDYVGWASSIIIIGATAVPAIGLAFIGHGLAPDDRFLKIFSTTLAITVAAVTVLTTACHYLHS